MKPPTASASIQLRRKRVSHHMPKVNSEVLRLALFEPVAGHCGNKARAKGAVAKQGAAAHEPKFGL
jgi:hypothetical protein